MKNYYEEIKENYKLNGNQSSIELFNDNAKFIISKMGFKVLLIAFLITFLPLLPLLISGDFQTIIKEGIINIFDPSELSEHSPMGVSVLDFKSRFAILNLILSLVVFVLQKYFIFDYFIKSKNQSPSDYLSRFRKGLLKNIGMFLLVSLLMFVISFVFGAILFVLRWLSVIIYFLIAFILSIFLQLIQISIYDDTRVKFGDIWSRAVEAFRKKEFAFKFIFSILITFLVSFTMNSLLLILPDSLKLVGVLIGSFLNSLFGLFITGFLVTTFIFCTDHVKYYLAKPYAMEYGYDPTEITNFSENIHE